METPPKIPGWILSLTNRKRNRENILGDFHEFYENIFEAKGKKYANRWYWKQALSSIPKFIISSFYWGVVMFQNYLKMTFRNIVKYKGYSFINIAGFAVGISCSILIMLWVIHESDFDKFHSKGDRIYRVLQHIKYENEVTWCITQGPLAPALKRDIPGVEDYSRVVYGNWRIKYEEKTLSRVGIYVDPGFFRMFDFKILQGNPEILEKDPNTVLLTESFAKETFGEENPLDKVINLYELKDVRVVGIVEDCPDNSHLRYEFISGMNLAKELNYTVDDWNNSAFVTYLLLNEKSDEKSIESKIYNFLDDKPTLEEWEKLTLQPLYDIHYSSGIGFEQSITVNSDYVVMFTIAAALIILLAGINYISLSTARSTLRAKEVGLRKTIGANRFHLIQQFLGESVIITILASILGIILVIFALPSFNDISGKHFLLNDVINFNILIKLFFIIVLIGLLAGFYPSLVLSYIKPANSLKGSYVLNKNGNILRRLMVVAQYSISSFLMLGTLVVLLQISFLKNKSLGYDKENLIYFYLSEKASDKYDILKNELLKNDKIINVCRSSTIPYFGITFSNAKWFWQGSDRENPSLIQSTYIDDEYLKTYDIKIVKGRDFSRQFSTNEDAIIINETAAKIIGFEDPIGKTIFYDAADKTIPYTIVGVCKDYNFRSLHSNIEPLFHLYADASLDAISIRLDSRDISKTLDWIGQTISSKIPDSAFDYSFLDEKLDNLYRKEERVKNILICFTVLAILISSLGLLGMASFTTTKRIKEIGVRKVLGSKVSQIIFLLIRDFSKWIIIANIISWPAAYYFINKWLQDYPYKTEINYGIFLLTGLFSLGIGIGTIIYKTYRAALTNPVNSLKCE